ncbi:MAG: Rrf2 family transcriptional regulator [bacterium]
MRISTKGRYALSLLVDLSKEEKGKYTSLKVVSERLDISYKYLEKIANMLVKNNLLEVLRGKQGGYRLLKDPSNYNIAEILKLTEKSMESVECVENPSVCKNKERCKKNTFYKKLDEVVENYLESVSLEDII